MNLWETTPIPTNLQQILKSPEFTEEILTDLEGNLVSDNPIKTQYGVAFHVNGKWVNPYVKEKTLEKKGYRFTE